MDIQLIKGEFNPNDALELITKMIEVKIKFHESKINTIHQEEDIKIREKKIKNLQNSLNEIRDFLNSKENTISINSSIQVE